MAERVRMQYLVVDRRERCVELLWSRLVGVELIPLIHELQSAVLILEDAASKRDHRNALRRAARLKRKGLAHTASPSPRRS
jgi:hypothetical protein